ncbi:Cytochrome P450 [Dillenia turbinata]|uniref:Cytochrome P450 n=1 Tax=Dillenia turbinata TaxID=194707 RepID=A0AAN8UUQ2_9MAGN
MEYIQVLSLSFSLLVLLFLFLVMLFVHEKNIKTKRKLPPGETGLPWIGETMDFYRSQRKNQLFEDFLQPRIARYGNIFKTNLMGAPTVVVSGAEANRFLLSNEFKLVVSSWPASSVQLMGKESIMEKQGDRHRCLRNIIGATFGHVGLEGLVPRICDLVKSQLSTTWDGNDKIINFHRFTKILTFSIMFECFLGFKVEEGLYAVFERVLEGCFAPALDIPGTKFSRAKKARKEIEVMMLKKVRETKKEIEERVEVESSDKGTLFSRLMDTYMRGEITEDEVVDNMVVLVFGAHDTTSFAIAITFKMLALHPKWYSLVLQEHEEVRSKKQPEETLTMEDIKKMKYSWQVARESMRLFPPIFGSFRKAITDIEYEGYTIPKGWKVLWTTYATHYNPEYFQDPLTFDPSRFEDGVQPYAFLPFGGGPRVCAGYQLAKLNIIILLHYVLTGYDWSLVHPDEPVTNDPLPMPSLGMPIRVTPKSS